MLLFIGRIIARCFYRVRACGVENLPPGGFLLLPNHVTWVDAIVLQLACPRPIRFLIYESIYMQPLMKPFFRALGAIPITQSKAKEALQRAADQIRKGEIVCIFPEGELSRTGILLRLKRGYELVAHAAEAPVVPVWLDQLWGSIFSFYGGRYFKKIPQHLRYPVTVAFGAPLPHDKADLSTLREKLLELGESCYQQRPILRGHLGEASLRGLKHRQFDTAIIDGLDHSRLSRGMLLAAAIALSRRLKKCCSNKRIAAVLPTGKGAVIANLAVMLAGKVPVNLNFTAGRGATEAAMRIADLDCAITAEAFAKKFPDFPFPKNVLHLEKLMRQLKTTIILWRAMVALLPWRLLALILRLPKYGDHNEAVVLFTSGSSGEPKGVVLSHRNILANVTQFSLMLNLKRGDSVLAALPFFHSFGCTVTLWYPMIEGVLMVTYPNPLEIAKNADLIERYRIKMLLSTPTFLRGYLRKADEKQLATLELVVTGAEKLPHELAQAFEAHFGKKVEQGYGLTETAPVVSVNLPEPALGKSDDAVQPSSRAGSVGKLAPGIAAQIRDPDTGAHLSLLETGMLWLRGPNIFEGYLRDPKRSAEVLQDGWFKTGDLGRFDEDGFLYIEGRLSRFSKIGGEMIPHETVENKIAELLGVAADHERSLAIVGIPDETKGEALVLLTTRDIEMSDLRARLAGSGMPNLWIPRKICRVDQVPVLSSGKLDLRRCRETALAATAEKLNSQTANPAS